MSPRPKTYSSTSMRFSMHVILKVTKPYFFHKLPKVTNQTFTKNKYYNYKSPLKKKQISSRLLPIKNGWYGGGLRTFNPWPPKRWSEKMVIFPPNGGVTQPQVAGDSWIPAISTIGNRQPSNGTHFPLKNVPEGYKTLGEIWRLDTQKTQGNHIWQHDIFFEKGLIRSGFQQSMRHRCEQTEMLQLRRAKASRVDDPEA